ncbi:MAG: hypothetical protein H0Z24_05815 [Thermosipho sp. (in: Bacteria)]|nr:hypothetical protein [Thermosipho sp. (in: thermotogales)]
MSINREELKKKYGDEQVLVVPLKALPELEEGLNLISSKVIEKLLEQSYFIPRWASDENPEEVEIIPYVVIRTVFTNKVFCVKRISGSNEKRLVNKLSIGIGGHINPDPRDLKGMYLVLASMQRELLEELEFDPKIMLKSGLQLLGLIRCTKTSVDKDHIGILFIIIVPDDFEDKISVKEVDTLEGKFELIESLKEKWNYDRLENWSKIALDNLVVVKGE